MEFEIYTDGASRNNPGPSASGYMIFDKSGKVLSKNIFYNGKATNNIAEYLAIIAALKKVAQEYGAAATINLFSDSELVVSQLEGRYKVRDMGLKEYYNQAHLLAISFSSCKFHSVRRENKFISMVDSELNLLLDRIGRGEQTRHGNQKRL